jgi:hypothetical protein
MEGSWVVDCPTVKASRTMVLRPPRGDAAWMNERLPTPATRWLPSRSQLFGDWTRINGRMRIRTDGSERAVDGVRGGQSSASALKCAAVHLNPTNQRWRGPRCVVPELKGGA